MRLTFLGSANALFSGGRANACVLLQDPAGQLLFECGPTTLYLLRRRGLDPESIDLIVITHLHGDHFGGLPFLLLDAREGGKPRRAPLRIIGPRGLQAQVRALMLALYPETDPDYWPFPLDWAEVAPGDSVNLSGRRLQAFRADHMSDRYLALCVRLESERKVVAFTGDTGARAPLADLARDADLLICECTHAEASASKDHPQHLSASDITRLRSSWSAKRVVLTHLTEESRLRAALIPDVEIADDGSEIEL